MYAYIYIYESDIFVKPAEEAPGEIPSNCKVQMLATSNGMQGGSKDPQRTPEDHPTQ